MQLPPQPLVDRFRADIERVAAPTDAGLLLAVSGGPDSLALLLLAHAAGLPIEAATVDHRLRTESAAEAVLVDQICRTLGVEHHAMTVERRCTRGNVSDWARRVRYNALESLANVRGLSLIATAHHADDQLETIIMRLNRGSGVAGLAGIRARNGRIVRPLLGWRRAELAEIVRASGIAAVDDPSNRDDAYDRARLRKALAGADWLDRQAAAISAGALADADVALDWAAAEAMRTQVVQTANRFHFDARGLPNELVRRIFEDLVMALNRGPTPLRSAPLTRALAALREGRVATLGGVKCLPGEVWTLALAPPRRVRSSVG